MSPSSFIRVDGLHKNFGETPVLRGVDLGVKKGESVFIIGRSGCGKSTLLRCLNGLETFDLGRIHVGGVQIQMSSGSRVPERQIRELRKNFGMVFQSFNLFPHLTVLENAIKAPMVVKGLSRAEAEAVAVPFLEKVGLKNQLLSFPHQISGGQQQRAAIARALAMNPKVMLYDEPTSALDPFLVDEVFQVMRNLGEEGMTQIVVTHEHRFAQEAADTVIFMEEGVVVEAGPAEQIFSAPTDERTRQFLRRYS
ncbi:MAG: amino acid ABC transporter ATP-binding protein [Bdellovibrionales bacterium]|nr:amino acid ABC transporter ATP-binding protein [Bdellovibrionales bacterium]